MTFTATKTRTVAPIRMVVYSEGGVGKSTFAARAPEAIFIAAEDGLLNIDAYSVTPVPRTWNDVIAAIDWIGTTSHKTIVIDSLDWLEPLCWAHVCGKAGKKDIEAFGYGKGYLAALDEWRVMLHRLSALRARGMHVVLIAHGWLRTYRNPEGDDYARWTIKLNEKAAGLIKEWVDIVGFACHETSSYEDKAGRVRGVATGKRILRTQPNATYDAKTRYTLPASVPLDWSTFFREIQATGPEAMDRLREELSVALAELGDAAVERGARSYLVERGESVQTLHEAHTTVRNYITKRNATGSTNGHE